MVKPTDQEKIAIEKSLLLLFQVERTHSLSGSVRKQKRKGGAMGKMFYCNIPGKKPVR